MSSVTPSSSVSLPTLTVGSNGQVTATGLVNNLDTTAIVNALMTAAAVPQQQLQTEVTTEQANLAQYQSLNQSLQALATATGDDAATNGLNLLDVSSSDPSVTGTASTAAVATTLSLQVNQVAQGQISVTDPMTTWGDPSGQITIVGSDGTPTTITAASDSVSDVVTAVNQAGLGVTAAAVPIGDDANGKMQYQIQFQSTSTGADSAFQVYAGAGTTGSRVDDTTVEQAQDAQVTLWPGTSAAQTMTSASNTINDIESGITVTVTQPTANPVTITTSLDSSTVENAASTLVSSVNTILGFITTNTTAATSTDSNGNATVTPAAFTGDYMVSEVATNLTNAVMSPVGADSMTSPSSIGIDIGDDGSLSFDSATFEAALAADPTDTIAAVQQIASRVQQAASQASDPTDGSITGDITSQNTQITDNQNAISQWTTLLAAKQSMLQTEYSNLVDTLGQLQDQQSYLQQQVALMDAPQTD